MMWRMKSRTNVFLEFLGWYGAAAIIISYTLYAYGIFSADSIWYHFLNFTGAAGIIAISLYKKTWQAAVVNVMWAGLALYALYVYV